MPGGCDSVRFSKSGCLPGSIAHQIDNIRPRAHQKNTENACSLPSSSHRKMIAGFRAIEDASVRHPISPVGCTVLNGTLGRC